jgi:4-hydroxybenzoate polyprenyltransferase
MRLFRPINLVIIAILQSIVQYNVIQGHMPASVVLFEHWQFVMIVAITILAGAGGYVVNDIYDIDIDAHNKPGKNVVEQISKRTGWAVYTMLVSFGAILTIQLGDPYRVPGIAIYVGATVILWAYSFYFKRQPIIGNVIVSFFSALVIYIVWLGQSVNIPPGADVQFPHHIILMYTGFAFFTTLLREIVKDLEDLSGDTRYGARTLPTVIGVNASRRVCIATALLLLTGISYWLFQMTGEISDLAFWYMVAAIMVPIAAAIWLIQKARDQSAWHNISQYLKAVILLGTLFLIFI